MIRLPENNEARYAYEAAINRPDSDDDPSAEYRRFASLAAAERMIANIRRRKAGTRHHIIIPASAVCCDVSGERMPAGTYFVVDIDRVNHIWAVDDFCNRRYQIASRDAISFAQ